MHLSSLNSFATPFFVEKHARGSYEKARLRFAHAETVVPFSCLLGLFHEGSGACLTFFISLMMCLYVYVPAYVCVEHF